MPPSINIILKQHEFPISVPSQPADIKATSMTLDMILLSWKAPVQTNGEVLSYTLYKRFQRSVSTLTVPGTERQFTFKGEQNIKLAARIFQPNDLAL